MRKFLSALLVAALVGLTSCANDAGSSAPASPDTLESSSNVVSIEETPTPEPTEEPTPEPTSMPEPEGIIIAEYQDNYKSGQSFQIYCLDPYTGTATEISHFQFPIWESGEDHYSTPNRLSYFILSDDFSKICATKVFGNSGECHAGWLDVDGNFFDVTEALNLQGNDFSPAYYSGYGFSGQLFGYYEHIPGEVKKTYFYVPTDNVVSSEIKDGNFLTVGRPFNEKGGLLYDSYGRIEYYPEDVTSWIDDHRCIVDWFDMFNNRRSYIVDAEAEKQIAYIPGDSRNNSCGVANPDGTKIAFLSWPDNSSLNPKVDIYITGIEDRNPVKIDTDSCPMDINKCILVDWR